MTQLWKHSVPKNLVHQLSNLEQAKYTVPSQASLLLVATFGTGTCVYVQPLDRSAYEECMKRRPLSREARQMASPRPRQSA